MIRFLYTLLGVLLLFSTALRAQSTYYWSDDRKIVLNEDHKTLAIQFHQKQDQALLLQQLKTVKQVAKAAYHPIAKRLIVDLHDKLPLDQVMATLKLEERAIKSWSYGYQLPDGFKVWLTHQIVLQPKNGVTPQQIEAFLSTTGTKAVLTATEYDYYILEVADPRNGLAIANQIHENQLTVWCHPDFYAKVTKHEDPLYKDQFQLNNTGQTIDRQRGVNDIDCNAPEAWTITKGNSELIVAVVDDGVEAHEDMVTSTGRSRILDGYTPVGNGKGLPLGDGAHGQSCAGIIAASHNDLGVRGIAPEVLILPINIFTEEETVSQVANAFNFARTNGAAVISNSWGYSTCEGSFGVLNAAISNAASKGRDGKGCIITFASGNSYNNCVEYPANLSTVIAVGAVTNTGVRSDYSNYGTDLDLMAPSNGAAGVRTIDRMGRNGYAAGNYTGDFGGTSAACPVVGGVAALVASVKPELTAAEITNILYATASDMGEAGRDNEYGFGRINAFAALNAALGETITTGYCLSQSEAAEDEWIKQVELGSFVHTSGASLYSDFTGKIITVAPGKTYALTITPGYSGQAFPDYINVWIDYNKNTAFEANELVLQKGPVGATTSGNITIPVGLTGRTRMRVALKYQSAPSACETFEFGEVEDYSVEFGEAVTSCDAPTNLGVNILNDTDVTLFWQAAQGAIGYEVRIRANGGNWVDFLDVEVDSLALTGFVAGETYEYQVRSYCGNSIFSTYSNSYEFDITNGSNTLSYCDAKGNSAEFQWIDLVSINEINNPTGSDGGYADYTRFTATLLAGSTDTLFVSKGPNSRYSFYWMVYIDFNQDGTFDANELVVKGSSESTNILFSLITIPFTALPGKTRMRVLMKYNEATDACGQFPYGEVEDYSVIINSPAPTLNLANQSNPSASLVQDMKLALYPNPTTDFIYLQVPESGAKVIMYDQLGRLVLQFVADEMMEKIDIRHLPNGLYQLVVSSALTLQDFSVVKS